MTMTLAESVAQLDVELAEAPMVARGILDITVLWQPKADAIRAAVRDFGLATIDGCSAYHGNRLEFMQRTMKAEINRVFGKVLEEKP